MNIGFILPSKAHFPAEDSVDAVLGIRRPALRPPAQLSQTVTVSQQAGVKPNVQRTLLISGSMQGKICEKMYDSKRHRLARKLLQEARANGAPELPSDVNVQDLLDATAADSSEHTILAAYAALLERCATLYPCMHSSCDLPRQRLIHDLLFLQGVCCDQCKDEGEGLCTVTMRNCLRGINIMLAALQPAVCQGRSVLVANHSSAITPTLQAAVHEIQSVSEME